MTTPADNGENLLAAKADLDDAIYRLAEPQPQLVDNRMHHIPSRYMQLYDAVPGQQGSGGGKSRSMPPLWLDAVMLLNEIDTAVEIWQPAYTGVPPTIGRLHWLMQRKWRPQDTRNINQIVAALKEWADNIDALMDPVTTKHISAPCPACGATTAYKRDSAGDLVRSPALQIVAEKGCTCGACHYTWTPDLYMHLSRVLGFETPDGVLE